MEVQESEVKELTEEIIGKNKGVPDLEVAKKMLNLKQSADSRNIKFDLSFLTVKKLMEQKRCFYTNRIFENKGDLALSIDRIDNKLGYIEGNVVSCTVEMNRKKADISLEEIEMIYRAIKKVKKTGTDKSD